jgi:hypothetical protein
VPVQINVLFTTKSLASIIPYNKRYKHYLAKVSNGGDDSYVQFFKTREEALEAYKVEKELRIKGLANKWKGVIEDRVYDAMMRYKVMQDTVFIR